MVQMARQTQVMAVLVQEAHRPEVKVGMAVLVLSLLLTQTHFLR
jgi:hypothetical protein